MSDVFLTADSHFDHKLVSGLRGFETPAEHDEEIVRRWNAVITKRDTVWHLGDVGMGGLARFGHYVDRLNGTIHLVLGNHDRPSPVNRDGYLHLREWMEHFASVQSFARLRYQGMTFLLSHYPYSGDHTIKARFDQHRLRDEGEWLLHGHIHSSEHYVPGSHEIHVGMDAWDLTPVPLRTLLPLTEDWRMGR